MEEFPLKYIQKGRNFDEEVYVNVAVHPGTTDEILLIIPGVDGSLDGYKQKYKTIAENINKKYGATVVRMNNPFNLAHDHCRNLTEVLKYIEWEYDMSKMKLHIMGHSLGGYMAGAEAHKYSYIDKILLINPAMRLDFVEMKAFEEGLKNRKKDKNFILIGSEDPSVIALIKYKDYANFHIVKGANHSFAGKHFKTFINAAEKYLFS